MFLVSHFARIYYFFSGIQRIVPAAKTEESTSFVETLDPNLAALIALLIVLFIGVILFSILCCCIKNWALASAAVKASKPKIPPGKKKNLKFLKIC